MRWRWFAFRRVDVSTQGLKDGLAELLEDWDVLGSTGLITSRRVVFTPSTEIKSELANTGITITCYDRNGNEVKRVNSSDSGDIEDPENDGSGS